MLLHSYPLLWSFLCISCRVALVYAEGNECPVESGIPHSQSTSEDVHTDAGQAGLPHMAEPYNGQDESDTTILFQTKMQIHSGTKESLHAGKTLEAEIQTEKQSQPKKEPQEEVPVQVTTYDEFSSSKLEESSVSSALQFTTNDEFSSSPAQALNSRRKALHSSNKGASQLTSGHGEVQPMTSPATDQDVGFFHKISKWVWSKTWEWYVARNELLHHIPLQVYAGQVPLWKFALQHQHLHSNSNISKFAPKARQHGQSFAARVPHKAIPLREFSGHDSVPATYPLLPLELSPLKDFEWYETRAWLYVGLSMTCLVLGFVNAFMFLDKTMDVEGVALGSRKDTKQASKVSAPLLALPNTTRDAASIEDQFSNAVSHEPVSSSEDTSDQNSTNQSPIDDDHDVDNVSASTLKSESDCTWPGGVPSLPVGEEVLGGDICAEALRLAGVKRVFGIPGVQNLGLYSALCNQGAAGDGNGVAVHLIANEEAAGFLAWGAWHQEGSVACVCVIGGPGVTHALSSIACAQRDGTPMLVLTSGVRRGKERFQLHDVDNLALLQPVCKALFRPAEVKEIGHMVAEAICATLHGRPGPVAIEIACDMYNEAGMFEWPPPEIQPPPITSSIFQYSIPPEPPGVQPCNGDDSLVVFLDELMSQANQVRVSGTLIADPGWCTLASAAAAQKVSWSDSWDLLCSGCGLLPGNGPAAKAAGCSIPAAIGVALSRAQGNLTDSGISVALLESSAFLVQGLELTYAPGLPLIVIVVRTTSDSSSEEGRLDFQAAAMGLGMRHYSVGFGDTSGLEVVLRDVTSGHMALVEALIEPSTVAGAEPTRTTPGNTTSRQRDETATQLHMIKSENQPDVALASLVNGLRLAGVELLFAAPKCVALQKVIDDISKVGKGNDGLEVVILTDSQSVGFACDAAARCCWGNGSTVACCLVDAVDPFGITALSGVGEAMQDGVPLVLLILSGEEMATGDDGQALLSQSPGPLQQVCKALFSVPSAPTQWSNVLCKASSVAATAPAGPVCVFLPRSALLSSDGAPRGPPLSLNQSVGVMPKIPTSLKAPKVVTCVNKFAPTTGAIAAAELLVKAQRPWIHVGAGAIRAAGLVKELAEMLGSMVSSTFSGKGVLSEDHPLWLWSIVGPAMPPPLRAVANQADVVLVLGAQLGEIASCRNQWPTQDLRVIHVDADAQVPGANFTPDVAIVADAFNATEEVLKAVMEKMDAQPMEKSDDSLRADLRSAHQEVQAKMTAEIQLAPDGRCSPYGLYKALQSAVPPETTVFVADSGNTTVLSAEFLRLAVPRCFLAPTDFSSMGYCVPAAIGAALASKVKGVSAPVVATVGDGAFLMTGLELATAKRLQLPLICVVLRDGELGMISGLQKARGDEVFCTSLPHGLETLRIGEFLKLPSRKVTSDSEASEAASWAYHAVAHGEGPVLIEALVSYAAPSFYARGAAGQEVSEHVASSEVEPLKPTRLPKASASVDTIQNWVRAEVESRSQSGLWDVSWCLDCACAVRGNWPEALSETGTVLGANEHDMTPRSYEDMKKHVDCLAGVLQGMGSGCGARVGLMMPNTIEHMVAHYAIISLQGVALNLNPRLAAPELATLLNDAAPRAIICHSSNATVLSAAASLLDKVSFASAVFWVGATPSTSEPCLGKTHNLAYAMTFGIVADSTGSTDDSDMTKSNAYCYGSVPCEMYYTSGTSGTPKAVLLSHKNVLCHALACVAEHRMSKADVWLHAAPMYHLVDAFAMFSVTCVGGAHVFSPGAFDAANLVTALRRHNITSTNLATSMVSLVLASPAARSLDGCFPKLRLISCGGAPLSRSATLQAQRLFGCEFFQSYGMTECCGKISMSLLDPEQRCKPLGEQLDMLCSNGRPFEVIDVRVIDLSSNEPIPHDGRTVGEIQVRGPTVFEGYGSSEVNQDCFLDGGWFRTGDLATIDGHGFMRVVDRLKDMILVGSENVFCVEVENVLISHPDVALCTVYGVPGPETIGELVKAVVQMRPGATKPSVEELQYFCHAQLADYKVPRIVEFNDKLPLTSTGKVAKAELKRREVAGDSSVTDSSANDDQRGWPAELSEHVYKTVWRSMPLQRYADAPLSEFDHSQWLVLADGQNGFASGLVAGLRARGVGASMAECLAGDQPQLSPPCNLDDCAGIFVLLPFNSSTPEQSNFTEETASRTHKSLQAMLVAASTSASASASLVIAGVCGVPDGESQGRPLAVDPAIAACWAFARVASTETGIPWRLVELCSHASSDDTAGALIAEAEAALRCDTASDSNDESIWKQGTRWVPQLERLSNTERHSQTGPVCYNFLSSESGDSGHADQSCMVIGGTGSLGRHLITFLSKSGQLREVVAVGRRPAGEVQMPAVQGTPTTVHVLSGDAADATSCRKLFQRVRSEMAPCMHVFHLAGVLPDNGQVPLVKQLQWGDCMPVLQPKVDGSLHLACIGDQELPSGWSLTCFSSIFGVLGYPRLAPYAAANGFQDGLMECRRLLGHRSLAVAWGAWAETGMAHRAGSGFHAFWRSEGMDFVPLQAGMEILGCILGLQDSPSCISIFPSLTPGPWPHALARHPRARGIVAEEPATSTTGAHARGGQAEYSTAAAPMRRTQSAPAGNLDKMSHSDDDVEQLVIQTLATLLRCDAAEISSSEPFAAMGLTSMMAIDLSSRLGQALGLNLPATLAFEMVDVAQLCTFLADQLRPKKSNVQKKHSNVAVARANARPVSDPSSSHLVGVACALPGGLHSARDTAQVWDFLMQGRDCISLPPLGRPTAAPRDDSHAADEPGFSEAGYLHPDEVVLFDAVPYGITSSEAEILDPQQRLCLRTAREALEDGSSNRATTSVGVFVGVTTVDFVLQAQKQAPSPYCGPALTTAVCANRISYVFDLCGPSMAIDTACSASIVTTNLALQAFQFQQCTSALVLGVNVQLQPYWTEAFVRAGMLSPTGRCRFADDKADGYVRGEGCACLLLAAEVDDSSQTGVMLPYAIVSGSAVNQDGRSNGLTAPNPAEQETVLKAAWENAGLPRTSAMYVEAHGTGTALGDPIEVLALGRSLRNTGSAAEGSSEEHVSPLRCTSFKSNIGHLECGAGAASLLKLALVLHRNAVPASLHVQKLNRHIDWTNCGVSVVTAPQVLLDSQRSKANAGVSGFGFGGTNGHIVLQAGADPPRPASRPRIQCPQIVSLCSHSPAALLNSAKHLAAWVRESLHKRTAVVSSNAAAKTSLDLDSLAPATAQRVVRTSKQTANCVRTAFVASSLRELSSKLSEFEQDFTAEMVNKVSAVKPKVALALVGNDEPRASSVFSTLQALGTSCAKNDNERLQATRDALGRCSQCTEAIQDSKALTCASLYVAAAAFIEDLGVKPCAIIGHGLAGEAAALAASGVLSADEALSVASGSQTDPTILSWPPCIPVASSLKGDFLDSLPTTKHWQELTTVPARLSSTALHETVETTNCDILLFVSISRSLLHELHSKKTNIPRIIATSLGPPPDGRVVSSDVPAKAILASAASLFSAGCEVNFEGWVGSACPARLPPQGEEKKLHWPEDPSSQDHKHRRATEAYIAVWVPCKVPRNLSPRGLLRETQCTYVVNDADGGTDPLGAAVVTALAQQGAVSRQVTGELQTADFNSAPTCVFVVGSPAKVPTYQDLLSRAREVPHAFLMWLRTVVKCSQGAGPIQTTLLTTDAYAADPDLKGLPQAALWGAARSARLELSSSVVIRCIDACTGEGVPDVAWRFAEELLQKENRDVLLGPCIEDRSVQVLQQLNLSPSPVAPSSACTSFTITGGTGALGLILGAWLGNHGTEHLVLASRSSRISDSNQSLWDALSDAKDCNVELFQCDASSETDVQCLVKRQVLKKAESLGVAHLAGALQDGLFVLQDKSAIDFTFGSKVDGALFLMRALRALRLAENCASFWLFSSVTSAIGNMGQTAYGAANSALDSMARGWTLGDLVVGPRRGATLALQWGPWAEFGMAAGEAHGMTKIWRQLKSTTGLATLAAVLDQNVGPVICLARFNWPEAERQLSTIPYYKGFLADHIKSTCHVKPQSFDQSGASPYVDLYKLVEGVMRKSLGVGMELSEDADFGDLGLDSLGGLSASHDLAAALEQYGFAGIGPMFVLEAGNLRGLLDKLQINKNSRARKCAKVGSEDETSTRSSTNGSEKVPILTADELVPKLAGLLQRHGVQINQDNEYEESQLTDLGLDSLAMLAFAEDIRKEFDIPTLSATLVLEAGMTIRKLSDVLTASVRNHQRDTQISIAAAEDQEMNLNQAKLQMEVHDLQSMSDSTPRMRFLFGLGLQLATWIMSVVVTVLTVLLLLVVFCGNTWKWLLNDKAEPRSIMHIAVVVCILVVCRWFVRFFLVWYLKLVCLGRVSEGIVSRWGIKGWLFRFVSEFCDFISMQVQEVFSRTPLEIWYYRLMGTKLGKNCDLMDNIATGFDLIEVGDNCILGCGGYRFFGCCFITGVRNLDWRKIVVGNDCKFGRNSFVLSGTVLGDGAVVMPSALAQGVVPAGSVVYGQVPQAPIPGCDAHVRAMQDRPIPSAMTSLASFAAFVFDVFRWTVAYWLFPDMWKFGDLILYTCNLGFSVADRHWETLYLNDFASQWYSVIFVIFVQWGVTNFVLLFFFTIASKWLLLGRLKEGTFRAGPWWLFRCEFVICMLRRTNSYMGGLFGTFPQVLWLKSLGLNTSWCWIPSSPRWTPLLLSVDLITIEKDVFCGNFFCISCISFETLSDGCQQVTCSPVTLKKHCFLGPVSSVVGPVTIGEDAATMDLSYVGPGQNVQSGRTFLGIGIEGVQAKRRTDVGKVSTSSIIPYNVATTGVVLFLQFINPYLSFGCSYVTLQLFLLVAYDQNVPVYESILSIKVVLLFFFNMFCWQFVALSVAICWKWCVMGHTPTDTAGSYRGWLQMKWVSTVAAGQILVCNVISRCWNMTPVVNWVVQACGGTVGKNAIISDFFAICQFPELDLCAVEEDGVVEGITYSHVFSSGALRFRRTKVGKGGYIQAFGMLCPGATVDQDCTLAFNSVLLPGSSSDAKVQVGIPAAPARPRVHSYKDPYMTFSDGAKAIW